MRFESYDKTRDEAVDQRIASELPTVYSSETQLSANQASPSCPPVYIYFATTPVPRSGIQEPSHMVE